MINITILSVVSNNDITGGSSITFRAELPCLITDWEAAIVEQQLKEVTQATLEPIVQAHKCANI